MLFGLFLCCVAQDSTQWAQPKPVFGMGAGIQYGSVFAHSVDVQNTKGAHPRGVELILSWQRNDAGAWNLCNCYPKSGMIVSLYDYDNHILGKGAIAAYFLEPVYKISPRFFFSFKAATGFGYLSNPFDSVKNPGNMSYSSHVSGYLLIGAGISYQLDPRLLLNATGNYQHLSNGGLKQPNKGVNYPTAGISFTYVPKPQRLYSGERKSAKDWKGKPWRKDIGLYGMGLRSQDKNGQSRRVPMIGFVTQFSKQIGRISALTIAVEGDYDRSLHEQLKKDASPHNGTRLMLSAGHEFLLGKFILSQRIGIYVYDPTPYFDLIFHNWGLYYRINDHFSTGFNLKAHKQIAEHASIRLVYSL
jgi:hypothetical protein